MKPGVWMVSAGLLCGCLPADADMLGITLNGDISQLAMTGRGGDFPTSQPLEFSDDVWQSWSIAFEHPMPLLPNVMLRRQIGNWNGQTQLRSDLRLAGQEYVSQSHIETAVDLGTTDVSFYYEVLDNHLLALDVGATLMHYDFELAVLQPDSAQFSESGYMPLLYSHLAVNVWGTDTRVFWQGSYTDFRDQQWAQTQVGLGYELLDLTALTIELKVGWQHQSIKLTKKDPLDADLLMKGAFIALEADF